MLPADVYELTWELEADESIAPYFHLEQDQEICYLSCDMRESLVGSVVTLRLNCNDVLTENAVLQIKVVSAFG